MKFILGIKQKMTQIFEEDGRVVPVTQVLVAPCVVTQIKHEDDKDGYNAIQLGCGKKKKLSKALKGHLKDLGDFRYIKEFRLSSKEELGELKRGDQIRIDIFEPGDKVKVVGVSKGRGFQGVVKRYGFHGSPASHGHKDQLRAPGSIGATEPARVFPGMKMPGHMGDAQVTVKNLTIAKVDLQNNFLYIKGAVPGACNGLLMISSEGELVVNKPEEGETQEAVETLRRDVLGTQEETATQDTTETSGEEDGSSQELKQSTDGDKNQ